MAGSVIVALRKAVVAGLAARAGLSGVKVSYGWPGDDKRKRERIFTNRPRGQQEPASLRPGRTFRDESGTFEIVLQVEGIGKDPEWTDDRAIALGAEVETWVADNRTGLAVTGLNWIVMDGWELNNLYNDRGSLTEITYTVRYQARLT